LFVRLAHGEARRLGADWESEAALLVIASRAGLAPAPVLTMPAAGLLVSEFVPGRILTRDEAQSPARVAAIGRLLRELHHLAPSPGIRRLDFATQAQTLESQLDAASQAAFAKQAAAVFARLRVGQGAPVPCHNDLHAQNILEHDQHLLLVDWEYGGLGDPVYDLAGCVIHFALDAAQRELLLDAYGMRAPRARLRDACWAYDYVQWLWYRVAAGQPGERGADALAEAASAVVRRLERSQGAG
jgi:thiamine kinase-like enzyme